MDLSAGAAIREDALPAAGACCCQGAATTAAAAGSMTIALAFLRLVTFRSGMINLELATNTTTVSIFYLCSLQPRQAA